MTRQERDFERKLMLHWRSWSFYLSCLVALVLIMRAIMYLFEALPRPMFQTVCREHRIEIHATEVINYDRATGLTTARLRMPMFSHGADTVQVVVRGK